MQSNLLCLLFVFSKGKCQNTLTLVQCFFRRKWQLCTVLADWGQTSSYHLCMIRNIPALCIGNPDSGAQNKLSGKTNQNNKPPTQQTKSPTDFHSLAFSIMPRSFLYFISSETKFPFSLPFIPGGSCSQVIKRCQKVELRLKKTPPECSWEVQEIAVVA